jgi:hypothetical protein
LVAVNEMFRCEIDFFQLWKDGGGKIGLAMGTQVNNLIKIET